MTPDAHMGAGDPDKGIPPWTLRTTPGRHAMTETPDAHMVETLRLRTAALHRVSRSNDLLRREVDDLRARLARVGEVLDDPWMNPEIYLGPVSSVLTTIQRRLRGAIGNAP